MSKKIHVKGNDITIIDTDNKEYVCLTDIVRNMADGQKLIEKWLSIKNTVEYLTIWETMNNNAFDTNTPEFGGIMQEAGSNRFTMSVKKWVESTKSIGLIAKLGRLGGTYAHKDIALKFCTWISPEFELLVLKEFQRLKEQEAKLINTEWDYRRFLSKVNYVIHTDAVKDNIIPKYYNLSRDEESYIYAHEAEILNMAIFGKTSKQWRQENAKAAIDGLNIRDLANVHQLNVLANLESINSLLIREGNSDKDRFNKLKEIAIHQLKSLSQHRYNFPLESPYKINYTSTLDRNLKGLLNVPPPKKDKPEE